MANKLTLLLVATLVSLAIAEISLRFTWVKSWRAYPVGLTIPDETKGFKLQPNFSGRYPSKQFYDIEININSKGLRDYEYAYKKTAGEKRIIAIGDSVTFGTGIKLDDTFVKKLEKKLAPWFEVINGGVPSYEFEQEYRYYIEELYKYDADILLINVVLNDAGKVDVSEVRQTRFDGRSILFQNVKASLGDCYICDFIHFSSGVILNYLRGEGKGYNEQYFRHIYGLWEGETWNYTERQMEQLILFSRERGTEPIIVIFPYTQQFASSKTRWDDKPQKKLAEFGDKNKVKIIDLLPHLDTPDYRQYYLYNDNVHLNETGNEIVSEILYKEINQTGAVSRTPTAIGNSKLLRAGPPH